MMTSTNVFKSPKVSLIVAALLPELGIGNKGKLPWAIKQEMKYFRKITSKTAHEEKRNAVIMGRKTYLSIPKRFRPLKDRINIVLSRDVEKLKLEIGAELIDNEDNLRLSDSLSSVIKSLQDSDKIEEIFIIGGAEVYNQLIKDHHDLIDAIYLTEITYKDKLEMDSYFNLDKDLWIKCDNEKLKKVLESKGLHEEFEVTGNIEDEFKFDFTLWEKKIV